MLNRRLGALAVAVVAGALCAATSPALSCGWNGCGYGYGYQQYYAQPVYYAQTTYYYAQPIYYQQPVYAQPSYYSPCCKGPNLWDSLFGNSNCCQPAYQPVASPAYVAPGGYAPYGYGAGYVEAGYVDDGSMYAGSDPGLRYAAVAPPPRYARPYGRRGHVVYRPGYRSYVGYRSRVVSRGPYHRRPYYRPRHPAAPYVR